MPSVNRSLLDTDNVGRMLFKLALPTFMGMFVMTMYNVVNTIFIGHYIGPLGIAGLSIVFPFQVFSFGIGQMTGMGGASMISRLIGAENHAKAEKVLGNAISVNIVMSIIFTIIGLSNPDFWLRLSGASDTILPYARDYWIVIFIGFISSTFAMSFNALMIAEGNTRLAMISQIAGALLNIGLDAIFIIGLGWGVKGAALGTVISQTMSVIVFMVYYLQGRSLLKIRLKNLLWDFSILKGILSIGISALASTLANSLTSILTMRLLMHYGGDLSISAYGILNRITMFALMPGIVIGQALQPLVGFNYGAKRYDRILKSLKIAIIASSAICVAAFFVMYFMPEPFVKIFTTETDLISGTTYAIHRAFFFIYLVGFVMVGSTLFLAAGKAGRAFVTSMARSALFFIPVLLFMANFFQLEGVWLTFPIVDVMTFSLILGLVIPEIKDLRRKLAAQNLADAAPATIIPELPK